MLQNNNTEQPSLSTYYNGDKEQDSSILPQISINNKSNNSQRNMIYLIAWLHISIPLSVAFLVRFMTVKNHHAIIMSSNTFNNDIGIADVTVQSWDGDNIVDNIHIFDAFWKGHHVANVDRVQMEVLLKHREQTGMNQVTTNVIYPQANNKNQSLLFPYSGIGFSKHSWVAFGDIDMYKMDNKTVFCRLQTNRFQNSYFSVTCHDSDDVCTISQSLSENVCIMHHGDDNSHSSFSNVYDYFSLGHQNNHRSLLSVVDAGEIKDKEGTKRPRPPGSMLRRLDITDTQPVAWENEVSPECRTYEYKLSLLFQKNHFLLMASPVYDDLKEQQNIQRHELQQTKSCPLLVVDADFLVETKNNKPRKMLSFVDSTLHSNQDDISAYYYNFDVQVEYGELMQAVTNASPSNVVQTFRLSSNNCGIYILNILQELRVNIVEDELLMDFIATALLKSNKIMSSLFSENFGGLVVTSNNNFNHPKQEYDSFLELDEHDKQSLVKQYIYAFVTTNKGL